LPLFGSKEEPKFWKYDVKYLGGHAAFPKDTDGNLCIYAEPESKVVFESKKVNMEIPFNITKDSKILTEKEVRARRVLLLGVMGFAWKKKHKMLVIDFEDKLGGTQSPVFESGNIDQISTTLYNLRLRAQPKS